MAASAPDHDAPFGGKRATLRQLVGLGLGLFAWATVVSILSLAYPGSQDEAAHVSYAVHLADQRRLLPDLTSFYMYDTASRQWAVEKSYLPHDPAFSRNYLTYPPGYYLILAPVVSVLSPLDSSDVYVLRLLNGLLVLGGLALALSLVLYQRHWASSSQVAYIVVLITAPALLPMAAQVTNGSLAFLGGCLAAFGAQRTLRPSADAGDGGWLALIAGAALAFAASPIAGAQVGLFVIGVVVAAVASRSLRPPRAPTLLIAITLAGVALLPYAVFIANYGSPIPETPGVRDVVAARNVGAMPDAGEATDALDTVDWIAVGLLGYPLQWPIGKWNNIILLVPIVIIFAACATGVVRAVRVTFAGGGEATERMVVAGAAAFVLVIGFCIGRLIVTDAFDSLRETLHPRSYFPLLPMAAMAIALAINGVVRRPRRRLLAGLVLAGCIVLFGPVYMLVNAALAAS